MRFYVLTNGLIRSRKLDGLAIAGPLGKGLFQANEQIVKLTDDVFLTLLQLLKLNDVGASFVHPLAVSLGINRREIYYPSVQHAGNIDTARKSLAKQRNWADFAGTSVET